MNCTHRRAGTSPGGGPWDHIDGWRRVLEVNLWGIINGVQTFTPHMLQQGTPAAIVNTGSKQGITCPPGDTAYNVSKAGVKVLTEALAHSLRNTEGAQISAHLWRWLYADTEISRYPGASPHPSDRAGGDLITGYFGFRGGVNTPNYALNLSLRPGFLQFNDAYLTSPEGGSPTPETGTITHFAWNFMLAGDYKLTRNLSIRVGIEETIVRYRQACYDASGIGTPEPLRWLVQGTACSQPPGIGKPPYLSWLSHEDFVNRGSWGYQIGPVFSF